MRETMPTFSGVVSNDAQETKLIVKIQDLRMGEGLRFRIVFFHLISFARQMHEYINIADFGNQEKVFFRSGLFHLMHKMNQSTNCKYILTYPNTIYE